jgi:hypothetical protein
LSEQVIHSFLLAFLATSLAVVSVFELRSGVVRSLFWHFGSIERKQKPGYFWFSWSAWAALAIFAVGAAARKGWSAIVAPDPTPMPGSELWKLGLLAGVMLLGLAWVGMGFLGAHRLWRYGNPLRATARARLRRATALRQLIRDLADDPSTGVDDITLDELIDLSDFSYLEALAAHLLAQPEPRRAALAIAALRDEELHLDADDRAYLVECGVDPDAPMDVEEEDWK